MKWIVAFAVLLGCGSKSPAGPAVPPGVLATITRSSGQWMDNARAFANAMKPGAGLMLSDELIASAAPRALGVKNLDGVDRREAIRVILVDENQGKGIEAALVAHVSDDTGLQDSKGTATILRSGEWAVIGPKAVVDVVGSWALSTQIGPAKPGVTATVYATEVMKVYGAHLDRFRSAAATEFANGNPALQRILQLYGDGAMALANDAQQVDVAVDATAETLSLDLAIAPKSGSPLAEFVAAQTPSDLGMIDKLPATAIPPLLIAGKLALGPYRAGFRGMIDVFYASMASTPELAAAVDGVMAAATGSFALLWRLDPVGAVLRQVVELDDAQSATAAIDKGLAAVSAGIKDAGPAHVDFAAVPGGDHDGVTVKGYQMSAKNGPAAKVLLATVGKTLVVASGETADERTGLAIDTLKGKAGHFITPSSWAAMLDRARKDKDSVAVVLDLARFGPSATDAPGVPLLVGIGFDSAVHLHLAIPPQAMQSFLP